RHTRSKRDWSSDVCSSDLIGEERRNVLTGEDSYWRDGSIVRMPFSCQEYFCTFFRFAPVLFSFYAPFSLSFRPVSPSLLSLFYEALCSSHLPTPPLVGFPPLFLRLRQGFFSLHQSRVTR